MDVNVNPNELVDPEFFDDLIEADEQQLDLIE